MRAYDLHTARRHREKIVELYLQQPEVEGFPEFILSMPALKKLYIRSAMLGQIPADIERLDQLESLLLDECGLTEVPKTLFNLPYLRQLSLCNNQLEGLPPGINKLRELRVLKIDDNQLASLPAELWQLPMLRSLSLQKNKLKKLYLPGKAPFAPLKKLNLSHNAIGRLPKPLFQFTGLEELVLHRNRIATLPPEIDRLEKVFRLDLSNNRLKTLPGSIYKLLMLRQLRLSKNRISTLPQSIAQLTWLSELYLDNNQIERFPAALNHCPRLRTLSLSKNQLASLPSALPNVLQLDLSHNQIELLPLLPTTLETLNLSNNKIGALPESIGQLSQLKQLKLAKNQLLSLPESFRRLHQLAELDLNGNQIKSLPQSLFMLEELRKLKGVADAESRKKLLRFIRICKQRTVPGKLRMLAYDILENEARQLTTFALPSLMEALLLGMSELALPIRRHLLEVRFEKVVIDRIPKGSRFYFLGATGYQKKWLEKTLSKLGFELVASSEETIDYLVLGRLLRAMNESVPPHFRHLLSRPAFTRLINQKMGKTFALQSDTKKEDNLRRLLFHQDSSSRKLAINILEGSGVPQGLLTDLFLAWKLDYGPPKRLENLLLQNVSEAALQAMYLPLGLRGNVSEAALRTNIKRYCSGNEFDGSTMLIFLNENSYN